MRKKFLKILAFLIGVCLIISLSRSIYQLLQASQQVGQTEEKLAKLEKEREELFKQKSYQESRFFIEKEAREKLNLSYPGEAIVILPDEEELIKQVQDFQAKTLPNYQRWLNLFI